MKIVNTINNRKKILRDSLNNIYKKLSNERQQINISLGLITIGIGYISSSLYSEHINSLINHLNEPKVKIGVAFIHLGIIGLFHTLIKRYKSNYDLGLLYIFCGISLLGIFLLSDPITSSNGTLLLQLIMKFNTITYEICFLMGTYFAGAGFSEIIIGLKKEEKLNLEQIAKFIYNVRLR